MQLDVYEYFLLHPWIVAQDIDDSEDFSDLFVVPRSIAKALRELNRSIRICRYNPRLPKPPKMEKYVSVMATNRLLATINIQKIFAELDAKAQNCALEEQLYSSIAFADYEPTDKFTPLAEPEIMGQVTCEAGVVITVAREWNGNMNLCFSHPVSLLELTPEEATRLADVLANKDNKLNKFNIANKANKEPELKHGLGYYVRPKSPDERASAHVKTWPWLVLEEKGDFLVVERITKTGAKRPDRFPKDYMEVVECSSP